MCKGCTIQCVCFDKSERDRRKRKKYCLFVQKRLQESLVLIRVVLCGLCSDGYVRIDRLCICVQTFPFRGHQWCTAHWRVSIYNLYMNCWSDAQFNARHCDSSCRFVLTGVVSERIDAVAYTICVNYVVQQNDSHRWWWPMKRYYV